jgi:hypothetical protein
METECSADLFGFAPVERRAVVAGFDGDRMTSDAGALLLGATDRTIALVDRFADCFADGRAPKLIEHSIRTLVGQRIFALALGYEYLVDHDELRQDPTLAVLVGKLSARRKDCAPLAGKSTLNRLELGRAEPTRTTGSLGMGPRSRHCLSICFWKRTHARPNRSFSTSTPPTIRCTAIKKAAFFTAITTATVICRCTFTAARDILEIFVDRGQLRNLAQPTLTPTGKRIPGLKLDNPRQLALMHALVRFAQIPAAGTFSTAEIYPHTVAALGATTQRYCLASLRYDLSKLRIKGLVEKLPRSRRYRLSPRDIPSASSS